MALTHLSEPLGQRVTADADTNRPLAMTSDAGGVVSRSVSGVQYHPVKIIAGEVYTLTVDGHPAGTPHYFETLALELTTRTSGGSRRKLDITLTTVGAGTTSMPRLIAEADEPVRLLIEGLPTSTADLNRQVTTITVGAIDFDCEVDILATVNRT